MSQAPRVRDISTGRFARAAVDLSKKVVSSRPARVVAGGLVWSADVDDQPYSATIGFELAVKLGRAGPADRVSYVIIDQA